jgi:hypothetical protein
VPFIPGFPVCRADVRARRIAVAAVRARPECTISSSREQTGRRRGLIPLSLFVWRWVCISAVICSARRDVNLALQGVIGIHTASSDAILPNAEPRVDHGGDILEPGDIRACARSATVHRQLFAPCRWPAPRTGRPVRYCPARPRAPFTGVEVIAALRAARAQGRPLPSTPVAAMGCRAIWRVRPGFDRSLIKPIHMARCARRSELAPAAPRARKGL